MSGTEPVVDREIGPRELYRVPLNKISGLKETLGSDNPQIDDDHLMRAVLEAYGLVRLTPTLERYLAAAFRLHVA